jgi:hypothetical protein
MVVVVIPSEAALWATRDLLLTVSVSLFAVIPAARKYYGSRSSEP